MMKVTIVAGTRQKTQGDTRMATTISIEVSRNEDGTINTNETLYNAENQLLALRTEESLQHDSLSRHVHAVFDTHLGKKLTIPNLQASVLHLLMNESEENTSVIMDNYKEWQDAVRTFIRNSSEFDVAKGKGGGAFRLCDVPPKPAKK